MATSGSTYPGRGWGSGDPPLVNLGGLTGRPRSLSPSSMTVDDPSALNGAVLGMLQFWEPIDICVGGTAAIRRHCETIIPREPREDDDAYNRRIFHAVLPPFLQRLASQAAGTILRRGIHLEGGDQEYWKDWAQDVTGDGTPLNEFCRRLLVSALLYGHSNVLVDYPGGEQPLTLADERLQGRKPYLVMVDAPQVLGFRTVDNRTQGNLSQVRFRQLVSEPSGSFGEEIIEEVRVLEPGKWQTWRFTSSSNENAGWELHGEGDFSLNEVPLVTIYSNRLGTLVSKPPLLEVANLNIAYCQRFTDYHHSIHVGSQPILCLKGFDPDSNNGLGLSVNTAVLLPPDGDAMYVEPTSSAYNSQLECLKTLEEQISTLGISTLARQNITNAAAEAKRLDRIDSDSIMAIISEDLQQAITDVLRMAGEYAGKEPPQVTIPKDYENRLLDGNQITAMLQLQMQNQISQETLLRILQEGEVLPPYVEIDDEILRTRDEMEEKMEFDLEAAAKALDQNVEQQGGATSGNAAGGLTKGSQTLPTAMRPGKHAS